MHFVASILSFQLLSFQLSPHVSQKTWKNAVREKSSFFKFSRVGPFGLVFAVQAATCGHLQPLAATCGHLPQQPLAATCGHSIGCKWLQVTLLWKFQILPVATCPSGHLRPLAATRVAASGCFFEFQIARVLRPQWILLYNIYRIAVQQDSPCQWRNVAAQEEGLLLSWRHSPGFLPGDMMRILMRIDEIWFAKTYSTAVTALTVKLHAGQRGM